MKYILTFHNIAFWDLVKTSYIYLHVLDGESNETGRSSREGQQSGVPTCRGCPRRFHLHNQQRWYNMLTDQFRYSGSTDDYNRH